MTTGRMNQVSLCRAPPALRQGVGLAVDEGVQQRGLAWEAVYYVDVLI